MPDRWTLDETLEPVPHNSDGRHCAEAAEPGPEQCVPSGAGWPNRPPMAIPEARGGLRARTIGSIRG